MFNWLQKFRPSEISTQATIGIRNYDILLLFLGHSEVRSFVVHKDLEFLNFFDYFLICIRLIYGFLSFLLLLKISYSIFDAGIVWFFANFWRCLEVLTVLFALSSQVLYTTQRSYTGVSCLYYKLLFVTVYYYKVIAWQKLEQEDYPEVLKNDPRTESIVGDISAASDAHQWQLASLGSGLMSNQLTI